MRLLPCWPSAQTASVGDAPGQDVTTIIAAQRFAKRFSETSSVFRPGNTTAYVGSLGAAVNFLISTTPFEANLDAAFNNYDKLDGQSLYVMTGDWLLSRASLCVCVAGKIEIQNPVIVAMRYNLPDCGQKQNGNRHSNCDACR